MRFFSSKTYDVAVLVNGSYFFISSERDIPRQPKRWYTIRRLDLDNPTCIETVGEFQQYGTYAAAERALRKHIATL